jgi:L-arabinose isomerase
LSPGRLAVLAPYWSFWEASVGPQLAADRQALTAAAAEMVQDLQFDSIRVIDGPGEGAAAATGAFDSEAATVLVLQSMAVPPAWTMEAIDALAGIPVIVFACYRDGEVPASFGHGGITAAGATVGAAQIVNVLCRRDRAHELVVGRVGDQAVADQLNRSLRAGVAAHRLARARVALVGEPQEGYACVDIDPAALRQATGIEVVHVAPGVVRDAYVDVPPESETCLRAEVASLFELAADVEEDQGLSRSLRLACALQALDEENRWSAGAMNCHVPEIRYAEDPGVTPCFALGRETTRGIPWTCTGDVPTAIAMLAVKALGQPALYHELEALDERTNELVIANSGEHDLAWGDGHGRPILRRNGWFAGDPRCGACAAYSSAPGPASLVAFTPHGQEDSGFRFIVAEGELTGRAFPATGTANGAFRFAGDEPVVDVFRRWCAAGPPHHSCCTTSHVADEVAAIARFLGVGCSRVC